MSRLIYHFWKLWKMMSRERLLAMAMISSSTSLQSDVIAQLCEREAFGHGHDAIEHFFAERPYCTAHSVEAARNHLYSSGSHSPGRTRNLVLPAEAFHGGIPFG
jgi:hypothetical protein